MRTVTAHTAQHESTTEPIAPPAAPATRRRDGLTRWKRMERETLTLERIAELHAAAYRAENKSERTVAWHREALARFGAWVQDDLGEAPCLASFTLDHVRAYLAHLRTQTCWLTREVMPAASRARPLSDGTVSWHARGLRAIASWLHSEGYTAENVLARLKPPKVADCEVDILSEAEIAQIVRSLNHHTESGARDLAVFATLLDAGIRAGELARLRLSDLHLDDGYLIVFGKGRKERPVKVGSRSIKAIRFYMTHWRTPARPNIDRVFLTVSRQMGKYEDLWVGGGEPLTVNALQILVKRVGRRAGVPRLYPHLLRHTFACMYLMQHHDPFALKNLLGHTSLAMTYRYVRAVERLMVIRGSGASVLDSVSLPLSSGSTAAAQPTRRRRA
jgi:site-specific recombinase XerD